MLELLAAEEVDEDCGGMLSALRSGSLERAWEDRLPQLQDPRAQIAPESFLPRVAVIAAVSVRLAMRAGEQMC